MPRAATADDQRRALEIACRRANVSVDDLWLGYFSLGGDAGAVEVEAYLHGLMPLPAGQRDILAHAANEHLDDLTTRLRIPYARVVRPATPPTGALAALVKLLEGMEQEPPEQLIGALDAAAAALGVEATVHLVDYGQRALIPLRAHPRAAGGAVIAGSPVPVESTLAGRAYQWLQIVPDEGEGDGPARLWVPLLDGTERLGALEVRLSDTDDPGDPQIRRECRWLADLLGHLITLSTGYGDALDTARRLTPRTPSAELIWDLLPPLTAGTDRFMIAGQLEPSASVGGDAFDYALSHDYAQLAIFDATGHSMTSGLVTAAAIAAYRSVRRTGGGLLDQGTAIDDVVSTHFTDRPLFLTAVLADLDLSTGRLRYLNAGHPAPLLVRRGKIVKSLTAGRRALFGTGHQPVTVGEEMLEPGDCLLLYTDGVPEARDEHGDFFGVDRLSDLLRRAVAAGFPPPETVRRLIVAVMDHQHGILQDDATLMLATWDPHLGKLV